MPSMIDHSHGSTGICGPAYYADDHFPHDYRDQIYLCNPVTGRVHRDRLDVRGSTLQVDTQPDFLTCDAPWFRPVDLKVGPDGALYVADFYNCIIGHCEVSLTHPRRDRRRGRIWRIVYRGEDRSGDSPLPPGDLTRASLEDLLKHLGDSSLVVRTLAAHEVVDCFGGEAVDATRGLFTDERSPEQRVHGLWILQRLDALTDEQIQKLAADDSRLVLREDAGHVTMADQEGRELRVPQSQIEERNQSLLSAMPGNFGSTMKENDFYDLMTYLLALAQQPAE